MVKLFYLFRFLFTYWWFGYFIGHNGISRNIAESRRKGVFIIEFTPDVKEIILSKNHSFIINEVWCEYDWRYSGKKKPIVSNRSFTICINFENVQEEKEWELLFKESNFTGKEVYSFRSLGIKDLDILKAGFSVDVHWRYTEGKEGPFGDFIKSIHFTPNYL